MSLQNRCVHAYMYSNMYMHIFVAADKHVRADTHVDTHAHISLKLNEKLILLLHFTCVFVCQHEFSILDLVDIEIVQMIFSSERLRVIY